MDSHESKNLQGRKPFEVGRERGTAKKQVSPATLALYFHQAGFCELLYMVGNGGRAYDLLLVQGTAGHTAVGGNLLQDGKTPRI